MFYLFNFFLPRKSGTKALLLYVLAGALILAIVGLILGLLFGLKDEETTNESVSPEQLISRCKASDGKGFQNYTVASDTSECSEIGCNVLAKKGTCCTFLNTQVLHSIFQIQSRGKNKQLAAMPKAARLNNVLLPTLFHFVSNIVQGPVV